MADVYVRSAAGGSNNGSSWANAYTTLAAALTAKAAGDNFWVAADHAEAPGAAVTLTSPGSDTLPCTVICAIHTGSSPPVSADFRTTAVVGPGGAGAFGIAIAAGRTYWYGIIFKTGTGANSSTITNSAVGYNYFKNCQFWKAGTTLSASAITLDSTTSDNAWGTVLDNTTVRFGATGDTLRLGMRLIWRNTPVGIDPAGSTPTSLLNLSQHANVLIDGVGLTCASTNLFAASSGNGTMTLKNCSLNASMAISILGSLAGRQVYLINCDSGAVNYNTRKHDYYADQTIETTIVRTGGASDGTQSVAWKVVTGANVKWVRPFECIPLAVWNDTTGSSVTVTVYGVWSGGATPLNDEIWAEVSYMGSGSTPLATLNTSNGKADFKATGSNQASDSSTWGGSTTKFKMAVTLSSPAPAMKGLIYVSIKVAKASSTFYIDPKPVLS